MNRDEWIDVERSQPELGQRVECWVTDRMDETNCYPAHGTYSGRNSTGRHLFSVANDRHTFVTHWRPVSLGPMVQ